MGLLMDENATAKEQILDRRRWTKARRFVKVINRAGVTSEDVAEWDRERWEIVAAVLNISGGNTAVPSEETRSKILQSLRGQEQRKRDLES